MTELPDLPSLLKKAKPLANRKRRFSAKIILRHLEVVRLWNTPSCQLLNYSQLGKILKVSGNVVIRDAVFLANHQLLAPFREKALPFQATESFQQYIERFLAAHGVEL